MIKIKPNTLYFKDPETGEFEQLLAIKGNPGSISNIADYFVSETGDSEMLAMTQKGATAIKEELVENIADTKTKLEEKLDKDIDDVVNNKTVATANYANYLCGEEATAAPSRPVWFSDSTYYDKKVYSRQFMYNPDTDTLMVGNITGKAAKADEATAVTGTEGTGSAPRHVWFSEASYPNQRAYTDKFKYNPYTDTLTVGNVSGNAATATKATQDGNGNNIADTYAPLSKLVKTITKSFNNGITIGKELNFGTMPTGKTISDVVAIAIEYFHNDGITTLHSVVAQEDNLADGAKITTNCSGLELQNNNTTFAMRLMNVTAYVTNTTSRYLMFKVNSLADAAIDSDFGAQFYTPATSGETGGYITIKVYIK